MNDTAADGAGQPAQSVEQTSAPSSPESAGAVPGSGEHDGGSSRRDWAGHAVNIRLTVPLLFRSYYVTIVAGPERRSRERRVGERRKHPLVTIGNVFVYLLAGSIFGLAALTPIELLFAHAVNTGSLVTGSLAALLLLAGIILCLWFLIWRLTQAFGRPQRAPDPAASAASEPRQEAGPSSILS